MKPKAMQNADNDTKTLTLPSTLDAVEQACERLIAEVRSRNFSDDDCFAIHLALEEALMNAARHGNALDPQKTVRIDYRLTDETFEITITDQGTGFDPDALPDPRSQENLYKYGGRGVLLMRAYMDAVQFNPAGNQVHMTKHRSTPNTPAPKTP